jgi:predicted NAD/FAD-binding protein
LAAANGQKAGNAHCDHRIQQRGGLGAIALSFSHRLRTEVQARRPNFGSVAPSRRSSGVVVNDDRGRNENYDRVVIASHSDQTPRDVSDADNRERTVLGNIGYATIYRLSATQTSG